VEILKTLNLKKIQTNVKKKINNSIKFKLPPKTLEVKPLTDSESIVITGKISKFPINVTFLHGAIERHNNCMNFILINLQ